ncbi:TonB-dependent receptor [Massilia yuzhufengensis]|uniref:Iron complex outermembrane recepter protein n=1 Tax=Massilia yuzhufengensis TaxID=1164594 RepID=A0A1I1FY38_9BURK|nr:TonB-dependent receptor [Massilia yuzhufengensis]SFC04377.1 iron complex outermembrane recepter protein [Massilia yuzhufengensis]
MTETLLSRALRRIFAGGGAVGLVSAGFTMLAAPPALLAQEVAPKPVARVEITGSNIRRAQAETASSVQTVNRADIERSGKTTVAELLQTLAVDNSGSVPTTFGGGFASGASGISLRGLGTASTLVLLNGRRMAPYGLADDGQKVFSDLNVIPTDAVERVEILKDGASAIYGSDAIAGVVNIILRRDFQGSTVRGMLGTGEAGDGRQNNLALTWGKGDIDADRFNLLLNFEYKKTDEIWNRERGNRDWVGKGDLRQWGFSAQEALGGTGAITGNNASGSAINGNVRNPDTLDYYNRGNLAGAGFTRTFPGAACGNFSNHPQGDPGGGCLIDAPFLYSQIQPDQETVSMFGRGTLKLSKDIEAYTELNFYNSLSESGTTPSTISANQGFPGGPVSNAAVAFGPDHPDNPYFGREARLRYLAADAGPRVSSIDSTFVRALVGARGTSAGWDWDSSLLYSRNKVTNDRTGYLQRDAVFAMLNPSATNVAAALAGNPGYRALPAGTLWRIGENAGLNSAAVYAALSPQITNDARTEIAQVDLRATREFGKLAGGALGVAVGAEFRHESTELEPTTGTERGNIIGLGYSAYEGQRNVFAAYGEVLAPVLPGLEVTGAMRWDHFTDVGDAYTPKLGVKWTPVRQLALRATWAKGFRAPSAAENGEGGLAAFSTAEDPLRCALGVTTACNPASIALITSPNPDLSPERSKSFNVGVIWDPLPRTSVSLDFWEIKRKNEINQEQVDAAILAGRVARDPSTAQAGIPGDPGAITAVLASYVNSAQTRVRGVDLDARQSLALPNNLGNLVFNAKWTHLLKWLRTEQDGSSRDFAGTHGNCDVTNCVGTPDNRANLSASWERPDFRLTANLQYRGKIDNTAFKDDPDGCATHFANGNDAPTDCKLTSFTTVDLVFRWKPQPRWEVFGSIQNVFDKIAPLDPLTYGAVAYNPLDYAGAVGRFFTLGARYTF